MTTLPIEIEIDDETAAAFREASDETREQIARHLALTMREQLRPRDERVATLVQLMDDLSREAQANGWTEEMNEALLRGDYDDEP